MTTPKKIRQPIQPLPLEATSLSRDHLEIIIQKMNEMIEEIECVIDFVNQLEQQYTNLKNDTLATMRGNIDSLQLWVEKTAKAKR